MTFSHFMGNRRSLAEVGCKRPRGHNPRFHKTMNFAERALPANSGNTGLIYDIGMCACEDTDFYLTKGYRVIAVEANPSACKAATQRYASEIAHGRLTIVNRAISTTCSPLVF